jgi:uncharacterized protein YkwD
VSPISPVRRSICTAVAAVLLAPATASAWCPDQDVIPRTDADLPAYERSVLCLINDEREQRDRRPLRGDYRLARAGAGHAGDMVQRRYFAHRSLGGADPLDRLRRAGYGAAGRSWMFGEILAWGTFARARPSAVVASWMASPGHREAILEPAFDEAGAGAVPGNPRYPDGGGVTVAVEFGRIMETAG